MNLDLSKWDILLGESICKPGVMDVRPHVRREFVWGHWSTPEWSAEVAFQRLGVKLVPMPRGVGRAGGCWTGEGIALDPTVACPVAVVAHELAHFLLGHQVEIRDIRDLVIRSASLGVGEYEADAVAMLVCYALGLESEVKYSRYYIQQYTQNAVTDLRDLGVDNLPTSYERLKTVAGQILAAGAGEAATEAYTAYQRELARRKRAAAELDRKNAAIRTKQAADFLAKLRKR